MSACLDAAQAFLQEAVYRSRARQAAGAALALPPAPAGGEALRRCGLGEKAAIELDLGPRGAELFETLWPSGLAPAALARLRAVRGAHGADRAQYGPDEARAFEDGLAAVNGEVAAGLASAAAALLAAAS